MKLKALAILATLLLLAGCGEVETPKPVKTMSFAELQSNYAQQLGLRGCTAFMVGDMTRAFEAFRILEKIVPDWEGYAAGVIQEGASFDANLCY
jgi:uncharacterized lipoprotein YajG